MLSKRMVLSFSPPLSLNPEILLYKPSERVSNKHVQWFIFTSCPRQDEHRCSASMRRFGSVSTIIFVNSATQQSAYVPCGFSFIGRLRAVC